MNQPTTQQDLIDVAAKDYEASYYKHRSKHADPQDHFTAGAEWALSNNEVMEGVIAPALEWAVKTFEPSIRRGVWYQFKKGSSEIIGEITTAELIKLYFEYLKQEEK